MSLLATAAPVPTSNEVENKTKRNKTLKAKNTKQSEKIRNMMKMLHKDVEQDETGLEDYRGNLESTASEYPPLPKSVGVQRTIDRENMQKQPSTEENEEDTDVDVENFSQLPSSYVKQYYQQYIPYYRQSESTDNPSGLNKDELLQKLDYLIEILESNKSEKTETVAEELLLYSFLGIFIIFIVDSFTNTKKYIR